MNVWLLAAIVLLAQAGVCGAVCMRVKSRLEALVAMECAGVLGSMCLLMLAQGYERSIYFELPLVLAVLSFIGALVFVRFMEPEQ